MTSPDGGSYPSMPFDLTIDYVLGFLACSAIVRRRAYLEVGGFSLERAQEIEPDFLKADDHGHEHHDHHHDEEIGSVGITTPGEVFCGAAR